MTGLWFTWPLLPFCSVSVSYNLSLSNLSHLIPCHEVTCLFYLSVSVPDSWYLSYTYQCLLITWPPFLTYLLYNSILIQTDHSLTSISSSNLSTLTCPIIYLSTLYLSIPVETAHCCQSNYHLSVGTVLYCTCPL